MQRVLTKYLECILGTVTDKAKAHMKKEAEQLAKEKAEASKKQTDFILSMQSCVYFIVFLTQNAKNVTDGTP